MQCFSIAYNMSLSLLCSGKTFGKTALKLIFIFFKHTECLSRRFSFFRATLMFSVSERETNCSPCSLPPHPTVSAEAVHQAAMISSCFLARSLDQSRAACAALAAAACALSRGLWPCLSFATQESSSCVQVAVLGCLPTCTQGHVAQLGAHLPAVGL